MYNDITMMVIAIATKIVTPNTIKAKGFLLGFLTFFLLLFFDIVKPRDAL